jgi:hypothetical protein
MADSSLPRRSPEIDWGRSRALLSTQIRAQLGRCDEMLLGDLAHEGLIILLRLARREGVDDLDRQVKTVARSVATNEIRRRKRRRSRRADWDQNLEHIVRLPESETGEWDDSLRELWFLLLEFFRVHHASCHSLAMTYAELGDWKAAGERLGLGFEAVRRQWSSCAGLFRAELRRDPGQFRDWVGDL